MSYLRRWTEDLLRRQSLVLSRVVRVQGIRDTHLGPRMEFAKIVVVIEPANTLDVALQIPQADLTAEHQSFLDQAVFGFLDVVMTNGPYPFRNLRLTILDAQFDPINSSAMAFRQAGRDAAQKFLAEVRAPRDA